MKKWIMDFASNKKNLFRYEIVVQSSVCIYVPV